MSYFEAIILAIVQGITEFLPVSSSAHLILVPELLGWADQGLAFDVAVHVGTLLAVLAFLRKDLYKIIPSWLIGWKSFDWDTSGKLGWLLILATIPVGLVGLFAGGFIEAHLRSSMVIAASTLVFGLLLGWADKSGDQNQKPMAELTWKQTLIVGLAQAFALIPGTSRSGVTMTAMLAMGFDRVASARFAFLMAVPAIALPGLLKGGELVGSGQAVAWDVLIIGAIVSAVMAFSCMHWFMRFIQHVGMKPFVIYRILLAILIITMVA